MLKKQDALWCKQGGWVNYGVGPGDEFGLCSGNINVGAASAGSIVEAHNDIVEQLFREGDEFRETIRRAALDKERNPIERLATVVCLLNGHS